MQKPLPIIKDAYDYAKSTRGNITHAKETVKVLTQNEITDPPTIVTAILHDCLYYGKGKLSEIKSFFGNDVANMVVALSRIERIHLTPNDPKNHEKIRRVIMSLSSNYRVFLIKISCRLARLRACGKSKTPECLLVAKQALSIDAPLAKASSLKNIAGELNDLGFKISEPLKYKQLKNLILDKEVFLKERLLGVKNKLELLMEQASVSAAISFRKKSPYSTHLKILKYLEKRKIKEYGVEKIHDLIGLRIIVRTEKDCYKALDAVQKNWGVEISEFDDYIARPKPNGYKSIHTIIKVGQAMYCEIQIVTTKMEEFNNFGGASHLGYKNPNWVKTYINKFVSDEIKSGDKTSNFNPFSKTIFTFTPTGDIIELPAGATCVDFAYKIHTDLGNRCEGALVNGIIKKLEYELQNGDEVKIIPSKRRPSPIAKWIDFVKTPEAKKQIRHYSNILSGTTRFG